MIFDDSMLRRQLTPWGVEVKKKLLEKNMKQDELVIWLRDRGSDIEKGHLTNLLYGIGITSRKDEIQAISKFLDIKVA